MCASMKYLWIGKYSGAIPRLDCRNRYHYVHNYADIVPASRLNFSQNTAKIA
jgi:hypothetical protein